MIIGLSDFLFFFFFFKLVCLQYISETAHATYEGGFHVKSFIWAYRLPRERGVFVCKLCVCVCVCLELLLLSYYKWDVQRRCFSYLFLFLSLSLSFFHTHTHYPSFSLSPSPSLYSNGVQERFPIGSAPKWAQQLPSTFFVFRARISLFLSSGKIVEQSTESGHNSHTWPFQFQVFESLQ